jgi:hypothetical protein
MADPKEEKQDEMGTSFAENPSENSAVVAPPPSTPQAISDDDIDYVCVRGID